MYTLILCLTLALVFLIYAMGLFSSRNHFPIEGKTIVLTGASSGLGLSLTSLLSSHGASLILVARNPEKLSQALSLAQSSARSPSHQRFRTLSSDLRSSSATKKLLEDATEWNGGCPPDIVWCCAGHCIPGFFAEMPLEGDDGLKGQMDTVYWSCANTAHAAINSWLKHPTQTSSSLPSSSSSPSARSTEPPERHLIFTASSAAFTSIAGYGAYSPAKRAIHALSDTLVQEFEMYNATPLPPLSPSSSPNNDHEKSLPPRQRHCYRIPLRIHTLFPMGILTPGFANENTLKPGLTLKLEESDQPQTPEAVASAALHGLQRGDYLITTMAVGHLLRGLGSGGSRRNGWGIQDAFWAVVGWLVMWGFVQRGFVGECRRWGAGAGKEKG